VPPIQIHHSVTDEEVPFRFGQTLADEMKPAGLTCDLHADGHRPVLCERARC